ncbi:MAG: alpha/beta hydrolase [Betaproteobacteria bacterium]|nr:alpha/beta hydrolase [Betaproteobacteria bacterium]
MVAFARFMTLVAEWPLKFRLVAADQIECPILIVHGLHDTIVPVEWAHKLYAAAGSKKKFLKVFTPEDGGSEHCHGDNRIVGSNYVADWLADNL